MAGPFPRPDSESSQPSVYLWVVTVIIVLVAILFLFMTSTVRQTRENAELTPTPQQEGDESSPFILFTAADIQIDTRWTLLSGRCPTVTFHCRLAPEVPRTEAVILCYRTPGSPEWNTVTASPRHGRHYRITLRDLYRDMPYECFFIARTRDSLVRSVCLRFHT